eukprot:scaffold99105_cov60-Phaeocystis_antarctica.AAC.13
MWTGGCSEADPCLLGTLGEGDDGVRAVDVAHQVPHLRINSLTAVLLQAPRRRGGPGKAHRLIDSYLSYDAGHDGGRDVRRKHGLRQPRLRGEVLAKVADLTEEVIDRTEAGRHAALCKLDSRVVFTAYDEVRRYHGELVAEGVTAG